jgi:DNA-binding transcriptional LysR family regulator
MELRSINLNLLASFDALREERNVTRAAKRMGVTQSAMSSSLAQLREIFDDPLFRRTAHGVEPTARALELAIPIRDGLRKLQEALSPRRFDPRTAQRTFVIAASDYVEFVVIPPLLRRLSTEAPGTRVEVRPWGRHEVPAMLARGEAELSIGFYESVPPRHHEEILFEDRYVCIVRAKHPQVGTKLTLARWLSLGHVLVSQSGEAVGSVDRALAKMGKTRTVAARVSHFLMVPTLVAGTDLVAALDERVARAFARPLALRVLRPPIPLPVGRIGQVWHEHADGDPAHRWLRDVLREECGRL